MAYERFPYTDFHDLNLDWVVAKVREMSDKLDDDIREVIREQLESMFIDIIYTASDETITFVIEA